MLRHRTQTTIRTDRMDRVRIGELSTLTGMGIEALRFYERARLLEPLPRARGEFRYYDRAAAVQRLDFIAHARLLGFSLREIARLLAAFRDPGSAQTDIRAVVLRKVAEIDRRMAAFANFREELLAAVQRLDASGEPRAALCQSLRGAAAKVDLQNGAVVGTIDTGFKAPLRSLAGVAEFKL